MITSSQVCCRTTLRKLNVQLHNFTRKLLNSVWCNNISFALPLVSQAWWDWPLTWLTNHCLSVPWHCWLDHMTRKIVPKMTYNLSTSHPTILHCEMQYFLLSLWVYSNRQSEGSVLLYCYRFMSSVSAVKSPDLPSHMWVICCNNIAATFTIFLCTLLYVCYVHVYY